MSQQAHLVCARIVALAKMARWALIVYRQKDGQRRGSLTVLEFDVWGSLSERDDDVAHHWRNSNHTDWHALRATEVEELLGAGPSGLDQLEAAKRLSTVGPNILKEEPPPGAVELLLRQLRSPLIYILLFAAAVTLVLREFIDMSVIVAVLVINTTIGFIQERQADRSVRALQQLLTPHAAVVRSGRTLDVTSSELVPGDLVLLESGKHVPADLRLVEASRLLVDESLLTGESAPVLKHTEPLGGDLVVQDRLNMAFAGTTVARGRGRGYVTATASATELGDIAIQMRTGELVETPLQRHIRSLSTIIGVVVAVAAILAFAFGLAAGEPLSEMFLVAVALAVSAVPEGLPVAFTITMATAVRRMAGHDVIVRQLPAVETLGSTTVIGSDKTGTITQNRMTVQSIWSGDRQGKPPAGSYEDARVTIGWGDQSRPDPMLLTLVSGVIANEASVSNEPDTANQFGGDPTEVALLVAAAEAGIDVYETRRDLSPVMDLPFEPDRRYSASTRLLPDGDASRYVTYVKGAPERVLQMSRQVLTEAGSAPIDEEGIARAVDSLAGDGLRVLAFAVLESAGAPPDLENLTGLTFVGLQGMIDPPRPGVEQAIADCRRAGIHVIMITGDHVATAAAIGSQLGLAATPDAVVDGSSIDRLDDDAFSELLKTAEVFARVTPRQKLRIVQQLREDGEIVAVTGDGVNDAPALRAADIGVAMGRDGTDVAREAAEMVLTDDDFTSIFEAVKQGRVTFDNLRKVTFFLVGTNVAEILAVLASLALGWPLPFRPTQILWLNLVTEGVQHVALAFEPAEPGVAEQSPRPPREGIINRVLWERTAIAGVVMTVGTLALFRMELNIADNLAQAQTVALTTMVLFEAFQVFSARTFRSVFRSNPLSNPYVLIATLAALAIHIGSLYFPPTQYVLRVEPLSLETWVRIIAVSAVIVLFMELHKLIRPNLSGRRASG